MFSFDRLRLWGLPRRVRLEERVQASNRLFHCDHLDVDLVPLRLGEVDNVGEIGIGARARGMIGRVRTIAGGSRVGIGRDCGGDEG